MQFKVKMRLNDMTEIEASAEGEIAVAIKQLGALLDFDGKCGLCSSKNITLNSRTAKGYNFTEFVCLGCNAKRSFGFNKEDKGTYLKQWEKFERKNDNQ
jgi:hypothetical protein